jgi:hypothetical protein
MGGERGSKLLKSVRPESEAVRFAFKPESSINKQHCKKRPEEPSTEIGTY